MSLTKERVDGASASVYTFSKFHFIKNFNIFLFLYFMGAHKVTRGNILFAFLLFFFFLSPVYWNLFPLCQKGTSLEIRDFFTKKKKKT